jgi:methionine sulfoxide reductase heme-binding subunit
LLSLAGTGPSPLWYATRATGVIALVLLTATLVLGVAGTARFATQRWPRVVTAGLHRNLSLLVVGFIGAHILTTVLDSYAPIGWISAVVPFTSSYRPIWISLGAIAFDMLLALLLSSLIRERLGYRAWRAVHWLAYACWPTALWHGLGTGTDSRLTWLLGLDAWCVAAVAGAVWWRISLRERRLGTVRVLLAIGAVPLITGVFLLAGPLRPGWARRAGTPTALLGAAAAHQAGGQSGALAGASRFRGHVIRTRGPENDETTITVAGRTSGSPREYLRITLQGRPDGSGVALSRGSVGIGPDRSAAGYLGPVVLRHGQRLSAVLRSATGSSVRARIMLVIHGSTATGRLSLRTGGPA